jgi:hypothetical protein
MINSNPTDYTTSAPPTFFSTKNNSYNLQKEIYGNYKNCLGPLKEYIKILDKQVSKGWNDMIELINDLFHSNELLSIAYGKYKDETLEKIDKLTKEKSYILDYINALKHMCEGYIHRLEHPPRI